MLRTLSPLRTITRTHLKCYIRSSPLVSVSGNEFFLFDQCRVVVLKVGGPGQRIFDGQFGSCEA